MEIKVGDLIQFHNSAARQGYGTVSDITAGTLSLIAVVEDGQQGSSTCCHKSDVIGIVHRTRLLSGENIGWWLWGMIGFDGLVARPPLALVDGSDWARQQHA